MNVCVYITFIVEYDISCLQLYGSFLGYICISGILAICLVYFVVDFYLYNNLENSENYLEGELLLLFVSQQFLSENLYY